MLPVVIYGAGGLGGQVQDILQQSERYRPVAFLDSNPAKHGRRVGGLPVQGGLSYIDELHRQQIRHVVVAVGDNVARVALAETLASHGLLLISAIHPLASVSPSAECDEHVIIGPRASVCVHARIGPHAVICAGAIIEHDNRIGKGAFLGPAVRLAGGVEVGDFATLQIGATVIPGRTVGRAARVAPGAVVIHDVPPSSQVGGVPAGTTTTVACAIAGGETAAVARAPLVLAR
jgi:sugar O-acyltransferase (sialic acid O-acetyltransferase NeuD family)